MEETPLQKRQRLDREIAQKMRDLDRKVDERDRLVKSCSHNWGPTQSDHIHHKGYRCPGDPPGTGGCGQAVAF